MGYENREDSQQMDDRNDPKVRAARHPPQIENFVGMLTDAAKAKIAQLEADKAALTQWALASDETNDQLRVENERLQADATRLSWLQEQIVDAIYLDDGRIVDVRGNDVRVAIDTVAALEQRAQTK